MNKTLKTNFKSINAIDIYNDMLDENSNVDKESVIESVYNNYTIICTRGKVMITKKGWSDGWMKFHYINSDNVNFYGLQECKRDVNPTDIQLKKQLLQNLKYYVDACVNPENPPKYKFKVFCLNSANFYSYVFVDEIYDLIEEIVPLLKKSTFSASKTWNDPTLREFILNKDIPFKTKLMPTQVDLAEIFTNIYRHCR